MKPIATRYTIVKARKFWHERTFLEKLQFWKDFTKDLFSPISPGEPGYESATYEEIILQAVTPFFKSPDKTV